MINKTYLAQPCKEACINQGFPEYHHVKAGRFGYPPEKCFCLTKEEADKNYKMLVGKKISVEQ